MARWSSIAALVFLVACDGGGVGSSPTVSDTSVETVVSSTTSEPAQESTSSTSVTTTSTTTTTQHSPGSVIGYEVYDVPNGSRPHDVAPAGDGTVWYTAQGTGRLGRLDPATGSVEEVPLGAGSAQAYAVYVDETDTVWLSDFGGDHALVRFDPRTESFDSFPLPTPGGGVRQLLGVPGEVWGAQSAADSLIVLRYES